MGPQCKGVDGQGKSKGKKVLQFGAIYIPRASMHIFVLSTQGAWVKNIILSQLDIYKRMKGLMLTISVRSPMFMCRWQCRSS